MGDEGMSGSSPAPVEPPDAAYVRQRWIPRAQVDWVKQCDQILMSHGVVVGSTVYSTKDRARNRARNLKRLMVELRVHQMWQLREHVERAQGGWIWSVEYLGRSDD